MAALSGFLALGSAISANGVLTELSGNGYARQPTMLSYDPVGDVMSYTGGTFGPASAAWTPATVAALFDASGNLVFSFTVQSYTVQNGGSYTLGAGTTSLPVPLSAGGTLAAKTSLGNVYALSGTVPVSGAPAISGPVPFSFSSSGSLAASPPIVVLPYAPTITPDFSQGNAFRVTLTGNLTLANPVNAVSGSTYRMFFVQDGTGNRTLTLGTAFKTAGGAPVLSTGANAQDRMAWYYDGTSFFGELFKAFA